MDPEAQDEIRRAAIIAAELKHGRIDDLVMVQAQEMPQTKASKPVASRKHLIYACVGALAVIIVVVGLAAGLQRRSTTEINQGVDSLGCKEETQAGGDPDARRLQLDNGFEWIGCFQRQSSVDTLRLDGALDRRSQASDCSDHCFTSHFGVVESTCYCYAEAPENRLSIGACDSVCAVPIGQRMETYFKTSMDQNCNQETTEAVRNFLVEEDDTPFGYDIISNEFRSSPFELYKDECGTNIYEVQTEVRISKTELTIPSAHVSLNRYLRGVMSYPPPPNLLLNSRKNDEAVSLNPSKPALSSVEKGCL